MKARQKPLKDQVIVITGASSGIGLATAKLAAAEGARLVLSSRNEQALDGICRELNARGGRTVYAVADVADQGAVKRIADKAIDEFGGFDTWVNNAAAMMFGELMTVSLEDERRLFDVNFWGVVHGTLAAIAHLGERGGTLINMGCVVSNKAVPLQGTYVATKHAVKAFTDALRMELQKQGLPVLVTLIKPAVIDTPLPRHARNYMDAKVKLLPPYYAPEIVARTILTCARQYHRDVIVGGIGGVGMIWMEKLMPRMGDRLLRRFGFSLQRLEGEPQDTEDALYQPPAREGKVHGGYPGYVARSSLFTSAYLHPIRTGLVLLGAGLAAAAGGASRGVRG